MAVRSGKYRGVPAEQRVAERRSRLLDATLQVWADPEVTTTVTGICAAAGLSERYFYESFRNIDQALTAVLDQIAAEIEEASSNAAERTEGDPVARVRASVLAFVELLTAQPHKGRVAIIEAGAIPALRHRRTQLLRHFAHRSAEEARELLGLSPGNERFDEVAGLLFIGGMAELITAWLDGSLEVTSEEIVDSATKSFLGLYS
ncbi:MAG: TetR/AcrR family transcriptional regulator [Marmoricola sp.]